MGVNFNNLGPRSAVAGGFVNKKYRGNGIRVINKTGSDIAVDKLVAVVGYDTTAELPKIVLADADVAAHRDVWVTREEINNDATGFVYKGGLSAPNLNTNSASAAGDPVYLSTTAGGFAHTAPSTAISREQIVGYVVTKSATVGEIHWDIQEPNVLSVDNVSRLVNTEVLTALDTLTAADSGKTIFLNSGTEFAVTLPSPAAGLNFRFIVTAAPSGASYTIVTAAAAQIIVGGVHDAGGAAGDVESTAGATTITFVDGQSVIGDTAILVSDGTNWYARVFVNVAAGATFTG